MDHGHEESIETKFLEGSEKHMWFLELLFGSRSDNYFIGLAVHMTAGVLIPKLLGLNIHPFFFTWWIFGASCGFQFAWFESILTSVEKTEKMVVTLRKIPVVTLGAGMWWLPFIDWIFFVNPEHKTDIQIQETIITPIEAICNENIQMIGSGIVNWKITDALKFMKINSNIMASNLKSAATGELQEIIINNTKKACIEANKALRDKIKAGNTQLHDIAEQFGVEIVSCSLVIVQSKKSMEAEEKIAIEGYEAQVLKREQQEFLDLKQKFMSSGMSAFDAAQMALAVMGKGSSFNFIGSAGDFTKGAAIK